ncbi:MAG TPA: hypothetical protein VFI22_01300, partial [Thermomicrobiales bacterium]|nr:hypothetical protein [Thermomicrobiales bacterium]
YCIANVDNLPISSDCIMVIQPALAGLSAQPGVFGAGRRRHDAAVLMGAGRMCQCSDRCLMFIDHD